MAKKRSSKSTATVFAKNPKHPGRPPAGHKWVEQPDGKKKAVKLSPSEKAAAAKRPAKRPGRRTRTASVLAKETYEHLDFTELAQVHGWVKDLLKAKGEERLKALKQERASVEKEIQELEG
jgi:hypothetical protein